MKYDELLITMFKQTLNRIYEKLIEDIYHFTQRKGSIAAYEIPITLAQWPFVSYTCLLVEEDSKVREQFSLNRGKKKNK